MSQVLDLVPIWTLILGMAAFFYVLLDGFDLGVGMLFGLAPNASSRNTIMNTIAPIWDGNETWLVLGGLGLLAAFPRRPDRRPPPGLCGRRGAPYGSDSSGESSRLRCGAI